MVVESTRQTYGLPLPAEEEVWFGLSSRSWLPAGYWIAALRNPEPEPAADLYELVINQPASGARAEFLCSRSSATHRDEQKEAIDFLVPLRTPVYAAKSGVIHEVMDVCDQHGLTSEFARFANHVTIRHDYGEFSQYVHLSPHASTGLGLRPGLRIGRGAQIGTVGMTGQTDRPHLHFLVFRGQLGPAGYQSLKIRWG
jgi:murein DD-endopeptidase MepM/ murein hydrolase activator NlpD